MHAAIQPPNVGNTPVMMVAFSLTGGFVLLVLGVLGMTAVVQPIVVPAQILDFDL
jgi:hypothetical protein